jgi:hypothetical protein
MEIVKQTMGIVLVVLLLWTISVPIIVVGLLWDYPEIMLCK